MTNRKVLILYASFGAGHIMATKAIVEAFASRYPDIEVRSADVLDFGFQIFRQGLPYSFDYITSKTPFLYKWFYDYYNHHSRYEFLNRASDSLIKKSEFVDFIKEFDPNFILSTNPLPMQLVSKTKQKNIIDILSANVCTDFGFHSFWHNPDVNYYFVANDAVKNSLIEHGAKPESVKITGIPISSKFSRETDHRIILNALRFNGSQPVLLIVGGVAAYKNLLKIIMGIREKNRSAQFIVVAGRDENLWKKLKKSKINRDSLVRTFGFADNLDEYMTAADLIFTKAGGLTMAECLAKGLPMVINYVIPGQEEDNLNYAVSRGTAIKAESVKESIEAVTGLFRQPEKLAEMKENCRKIARPNAASDLADFIVQVLSKF